MNKIIVVLLAVVILFVGYIYIARGGLKLGDAGSPNFIKSPTNTSISCSNSTSTSVLTAAGSRNFAIFSNASTTLTYLCETATCSANNGIALIQGGQFKIDVSDLYPGPVSCISSGATTTLSVIFNQ